QCCCALVEEEEEEEDGEGAVDERIRADTAVGMGKIGVRVFEEGFLKIGQPSSIEEERVF
uniref:Uncharacterized protein n=1 Tax=Cucumis melo TaxID=3656 RepID=A0A9I9E1L1_CUCME